jgi:putative ABC transport system permease protein
MWIRRIRYWMKSIHRQAELREEMEAHIEERAAALEEQGLKRPDAVAEARRRFGNLTRKHEESREIWISRWLTDFAQDMRHGIRLFASDPGFTAAAVLTLAFGIGANTAIFSVVKAVLLEPLPYYRSDRIVQLIQTVPGSLSVTGKPSRSTAMDFVEVFELQKQSQTLSRIALYETRREVTLGGEEPVRVVGTLVSSSLFPMLGVQPFLGRPFTEAEDKPGAEQPVILSYPAWQQYFAGDINVLNRKITLDGRSAVIIGVMPNGFRFPDEASEFWAPLDLTLPAGFFKWATPLARLKDSVAMATAAAEVTTIVARLRQTYPPDRVVPPASFEVTSLKDEMVRPVRSALIVLMVAVAFVLLIACSNVANLLLARGAARHGELTIRAALGAGRGRLVRQTITESLLLGLTGGAAGLAVAAAGIGLLRNLRSENVPRIGAAGLDSGVLAFTLALGVLTSLLFGLIPSLQLSRESHSNTMKKASGQQTAGHRPVWDLVLIAETAMAVILLIGGGLLVRSFIKLANVNPGFEPTHVLGFQVAVPDPINRRGLTEELAHDFESRLRSLPVVKSVAFANALPLVARDGYSQPRIQGVPSLEGQPEYREVSWNYFGTMGLRILAGRGFLESDGAGQPRVIIINQAMARHFGGENPLGKKLTLGRDAAEIVGIVNDLHDQGLDTEARPEVFADSRQSPLRSLNAETLYWAYFVVRCNCDPKSMIPDIRSMLMQMLPGATLKLNAADMADVVSSSIARPRLYAELLSLFGVLAAILGMIGIYGVTRYSVARRTREIGIRIALGAKPLEVVGLAVRQSLMPTIIGMALGLMGAALLTRYLESMLFGLVPLDPITFAAVPVAFAAVAVVAAFLPARRAAGVDPLVALHYE